MRQKEKRSVIYSAFLLFKRAIVMVMIVTIVALAVWGESMPKPAKSVLTYLTGVNYRDNDQEMIPDKFRIEKNNNFQENISGSLPQLPIDSRDI